MEPPPGMPPLYSDTRERGVRTSSTGQVDTSALRGRASEERGERERTFATSTAVSPILRDSALRKMGERSVGVTDRRRLGASSCFSAALQCYSRLLPALPSAVLRWWFWSCRAPQGWSERRPSTGGTTPLACHGSTTEDSPYEACRRLPHPTSSSPHHHLLARP